MESNKKKKKNDDGQQIEKDISSSNNEDDKENAMGSSGLEPMDTIFVKHIREGGPAHRAGLATGDRIVSVNGETISGKTYSEVVQLIQKSRNSLQLLVVPKEDDILQLYFPGTAYHGETTYGPRDSSNTYKKTSSDFRNFHAFPSNFSSSSSSSLSSLNNPHFDDSSNRQMSSFPLSLTRENGEVRKEEMTEQYKSSGFPSSSQSNCSVTSKTMLHSNSLARGNISETRHAYPFKSESFLPTTYTQQMNSKYFSSHPEHFSKVDVKTDNYASPDNFKQNQHSQPLFSWENASQSLPSNSHQNSGFSQSLYLKSSHNSESSAKTQCNGEKNFHDSLGKCQIVSKDFSENHNHPFSNQVWYVDNDRLAERLKQSLEKKEKFLLKSNEHDDSTSDSSSLNFPQPSMFIVNRSAKREFTPQSQIVNHSAWPQKLHGRKTLPGNDISGNTHFNHDNCDTQNEKSVQKSSLVNHEVRSAQNQIISGIGSVKFQTQSNNLNSESNLSAINESSSSLNVDNANKSSHNHLTSNTDNCFKPYFTSSSFQHKAIAPKRASFLRKASSLDSDVPRPSTLRPIENQQLQFQLVSQRTKQFESGSVEDEAKYRTNLYRNELCRLSSKCQTPSVSLRTAQFESLSSSQDTCSSEENGSHSMHLKQNRDKHEFKWQRSYSDSVSCGLSAATTAAAEINASSLPDDDNRCKNSLFVPSMPVPSRKTTSDSSRKIQQTYDAAGTENDSVSKLSFDSVSAEEDEFPRKKAVRQNSYLQAVQSPYKGISSLAITVSATTSTTNSITTTSTKTTSTPLIEPYFSLAGIVLERKAFYEDEPLIAGITNAKPRSHKQLDGKLDKEQDSDKNETPCNRAQNLQKLKAFFGEKTPQILEAAEKHSSSSEILKEGFLHCKVIAIDGKRSADRSWKQFWGCLKGSTLFLHRDKISQQLLSPEEQALALKPVSADVAYNYTKKKNVFQLIASNGTEYLLQAEDNEEMQDWIYYIQNHCITDNMNVENQLVCSRPTDHLTRLSPQPIQKKIKKLTSFRNRSPTNQSPVVKNRKTIHGEDIFPKAKTWKGKMVKTIKKIHGTTSSSPDVPEGVTINVPLEDCPPSSVNEYVPLFVELCTSIVEARGLEMVGIYRVPGNTAAVTALLDAVNKGFDNLNLQDPRWNDVNVISSMLKAFFRKLPDPLITSELYPFFIAANKITDNSQKLFTFKKLLHKLPDHHYESLKFLIKHLRKIVSHSVINKMEARNLAIVFGPTLVRAADDNMATMVTDMSHQCCIVETLINKAPWFFEDEDDYNWECYKNLSQNDLLQQENSASYNDIILNNARSSLEASNSEAINAKEIIASIIAAANEVARKKTKKFSVLSAPVFSDHTNYDSHDHNQKLQYENNEMQPFYCNVKTRSSGMEAINNELGNQHFHSGKRTASADSLSTYQDSHRRLKENAYELDQGHFLNTVGANHRSTNHERVSTANKLYEDGILRTYSGLSASTQERIRRFEMETRALLQRDLNRQQKENEQRQAERERIELEWQKAKHDLEQEDPLDVLADNLSAESSTKSNENVSSNSSSSNNLTDFKTLHRFRVSPVKMTGNSSSAISRPSCTRQALANRKTHLHYESSESELKTKNFIYHSDKESGVKMDSSDSRQILDSFTNNVNSGIQSDANIQFGSLDSLQGLSEKSLSSLTSSEESDLMSSITATLNHRLSKLQDSNTILNSCNISSKQKPFKVRGDSLADVSSLPPKDHYCPFRDPSLHRNQEAPASSEGSVTSLSKASNEHISQVNKEKMYSMPKNSVNRHSNDHLAIDTISSNFSKRIHTPITHGKKGASEQSNNTINNLKKISENPVANEHDSDEDSSNVQVHRNEHTLITATVSTTKQTVTSSATTAVITATIVTKSSKKKINDLKEKNISENKTLQKVSDINKSQKEMTNVTEKNIRRNKFLNSTASALENSLAKMPLPILSSSPPLQRNRAKQNSLKRRHTVGGTKDFDKFQFLLSKNVPVKDSQLSAWERLQPDVLGEEMTTPQRTMKHWLERERLRMSFPNLTTVKFPIDF